MQNYCSSITGRLTSFPGTALLFVLVTFQLSSCEAIFERDISEDSLNLILPANNDTASTNNILFKWDELKGASHYNLQIVQPSFTSIDAFILDSNIEGEQFNIVLAPGNYQFQIRGENSAYQSLWTGPYNLVVDSVSDLTNQIVPLVAPADALYSNDVNFTFSWQSIYAAESYEFQLRAGANFLSSGTILHGAAGIYGTAYSPPAGLFNTEGAYSWGVRAANQTSISAFSSRTILLDLTVPNSPASVSPAHGATAVDTVVLKWSTGTDSGIIQSPVSSVVQISADTLFGTVLFTHTITADTVEHVFNNPGTFWWRVYTVDQAGNMCTNFSAHRKIIIP